MLLFDCLQFSIKCFNKDERGQPTFDSSEKEPPEHQDVNKEAENVAKHQLRADGPPEEAKIAGVPEPSVDAMRNELVSLTLLFLNVVVEVCGCCDHGDSPSNLTDYDQAKAKELHPFVCDVRLPLRKEGRCQDGLDHGGRVGQVVGHAVREQQECRYGCIRQIVACVRPELQEVKERKRSEEEAGPPQPALLLKGDVKVQKHGGAKCEAERE